MALRATMYLGPSRLARRHQEREVYQAKQRSLWGCRFHHHRYRIAVPSPSLMCPLPLPLPLSRSRLNCPANPS
eukprot:7970512-Pyramimonas_sp.AAC.1